LQENHDYEQACVRYLLGEMSEQEQTEFEEAYFADDSRFERFLMVKDDLVDSFARGELGGLERDRFEHHFLGSEPRRQRVAEAKELIRAVTEAAPKATSEVAPGVLTRHDSWWQSITRMVVSRPLVLRLALAALLIVAISGAWLIIKSVRNERAERERKEAEEVARQRKEAEDANKGAPSINDNTTDNKSRSDNSIGTLGEQSPKRTPPTSAQVASLLLLPINSRDSSNGNTLTLKADTQVVNLHLPMKSDDYQSYNISLQTVDGKQVLTNHGLRAKTVRDVAMINLALNSSLLIHQDYIVTLSGLTRDGKLETINEYYFKIERISP
jgi:hypothetical protein